MGTALRYVRSNALGLVAIFIALGGTTYAAVSIPSGSVGAAQLRNHSITPVKLSGKYFNGQVRGWAVVQANGHLVTGAGKPRSAESAIAGSYNIVWGVRLPRTCATVANINHRSQPTESVPVSGIPSHPEVAGFVSDVATSTFHGESLTSVTTFDQSGRVRPLGFDLAVIC